ncbi:hypothetical protein EUX98_g3387 [Antrodiella citrinella]|uniref:Uncharacterized protein n=1 Tax=Antrodiella citrinella TaxID=2447956 RepID=A0A4S4MWN4_9APHY|nr:hypothetical protein EUX98_g3387 [Antrodiella citrinella]
MQAEVSEDSEEDLNPRVQVTLSVTTVTICHVRVTGRVLPPASKASLTTRLNVQIPHNSLYSLPPLRRVETMADQVLVNTANRAGYTCLAFARDGSEIEVKVISLEDTTDMKVLQGHEKAVRRVTWHPSGSLLTTCGADGKIIIWDLTGDEPKEEKVIEGLIPEVSNSQAPEFNHDCSAIWHTSGQYFFTATKAHEIVTISRSDWSKQATYTDDASSGAVTAIALSRNGLYLASASKSGIFIWSTQNRRMLYRYQGAITVMITQLAFSPSQNMLAWTDMDGVLTRWPNPIPANAPDPVKSTNASATTTVPVRRGATPTLFDTNADAKGGNDDVDLDDDMGVDLDNDDWILDDLGDGMVDDEKAWTGKGVREMVSVTKAQPAFQPGSTPMENKKRYLAYNMIGVVEVTDQDTHYIVNVEFHDRSARKSYHFTDHFKYDLASLGERGALYACQPENDHPAHVMYKPYGLWANQGEWTYDLPKGVRVLGIAAGGPPPTKSMRLLSDADVQGNGNVVIATNEGELIFLTGGGVEKYCLSLQGDFVSMVAGPEWVFLVHRDGSTTMDGSQNLTGRLIKFNDYCLLQKDTLPIPKGHMLQWLGISEEGAPMIYDSSGVLNALPRFRLPFAATWTRVLNTNTLARREGKQESYWPVGVSGETFMCLILKGKQEHPGFPRPLIQELPLQFPFKRIETKDGQLEEHLARESMLLDIIRDGLGDELTTDDISRRELTLDKEIIQLIQSACKADKLARAIDLVKLLHHTASFEMAIKVAQFYHLLGLQEKMEVLRDDREDGEDRLERARDRRRDSLKDFRAVPPPRLTQYAESSSKPKAFQDFRPPPVIHRPGLERAGPSSNSKRSTQVTANEPASSWDTTDDSPFLDADAGDEYVAEPTPDGKRKRSEERESSTAADPKRRAVVGESISAAPAQKHNPFARKAGTDTGRTNPFTSRPAEALMNQKSLHKSESFFTKVDAAETDKSRRPLKGKAKKDTGGRQTTLFGLPSVSVPEKEKKVPGRKKKAESQREGSTIEETESTVIDSQATELIESQMTETDVPMEETQPVEEPPAMEVTADGVEEPIEWPASPSAGSNTLVDVGAS